MTGDDKRRPYAAQDQFALERDFRGNPLMAAVKLARYKFPARLIAPEDRVLDLGCGNGYGAYFYATVAREVVGLDLHADLDGAAHRGLARENLALVKGDILDPPLEVVDATFDVIVAIDVIEHFYRDDGARIVADYAARLSERGMMILGTPNRGSGAYRSEASRRVHMYEYEPDELRSLCDRHFKRTLLFSMNDEVVHTGFAKMAWFFYVLAFKWPLAGGADRVRDRETRSRPPMTVAFGTKAETLERLEGRLASAVVLPQVRVTVDDWRRDRQAAVDAVVGQPWAGEAVIVRSSARAEDRVGTSMAGRYRSVPSVAGGDALAAAIDRVVESFDGADDGDQVLVQPMLGDIAFSGVAFGRDPNTGGPYQVIAYDTSGRTAEAVTSGGSSGVETYVRHRRAEDPADPALAPVIRLIEELAAIFGTDALDIEFAVGTDGTVILLQVRPLAIGDDGGAGLDNHADTVASIARKIELMNRPNPYLLGGRAVFGVMPDWNPAEMIGVRPRPLALSLYRELITDSTWAYQRDNYGYRNLRSFPLLVDFHGLPYIDVRVTFNSFIPKDIGHGLAERLADYYLDRLVAAPTLHDKVEFEIIFSCYTLDLADRLGVLAGHGFSEDDCRCLSDSLRTLTNRIIRNEGGLWRRDLDRVHELEARQKAIMASGLDRVSRIYWLLEHAKRYGTLPFAGLARAAFIAVQLLRSLIAVGVLRSDEHDLFMTSLDTVGSRLTRDFRDLSRETFLARYGHLRPGTYDILSARYDEAPDLYFDWSNRGPNGGTANARSFALSIAQLRRIEDLLAEHGLEHSAVGLLGFIKASIEGRELAKFVFTRSVSDALSLFQDLGREFGFSREDCAYADIRVIRDLYIGSGDPAEVVGRSIEAGKRRHALTRSLNLPPLIVDPQDAWAFHVPRFEPNFVTQREAIGPVATDISRGGPLDGGIVLIPSADPGYDWIFSRGIAGFITQYGGVNSHMAIRAGELGIPAVIGAGEALFSEWAAAEMLLVDCANRQVQVLR